ncbi:MAG: class I SAM-dependent methyltransferase [Candidatus Methanospirareceae archaeon]
MGYMELLKERLDKLTRIDRNDPRYKFWVEYDIRAIERGRRIIEALKPFLRGKRVKILDIGCGTGGIAIAFALDGAEVVASDPDETALKIGFERALEEKAEVEWVIAMGEKSPFVDSSFDVIICNDVIEHVESVRGLVAELYRLLKKGGILYLTTPNKYSLYNILWDDHTGLPFITLMPKSLQDIMVKFSGLSEKGLPFILRPVGYSQLKRILEGIGFKVHENLLEADIKRKIFYSQTDILRSARSSRRPMVTKMLAILLKLCFKALKGLGMTDLWWGTMKRIYPTLIFIGVKGEERTL